MRTLLVVVGGGLVIAMFPCLTAAQVTFPDDFGDGIDPEHWTIWTNQPNFVVDDSGGDVHFSNPYGGIGWGYFHDISLAFNGRLSGDFDVSIRFDELELEYPGQGADGYSEASFGVFLGGQDIVVGRRNCMNTGETIGVWEAPPDSWVGVKPSTAASGVFRIVREGIHVTAYLDTDPILSGDYNGEQVTGLWFRLANWGSEGRVSVRFDDFNVKAEKIEFPTEKWFRSSAVTTTNAGEQHTGLGFRPDGGEAAIAYTDPDTSELRVVRGTPDGPGWLWSQPEVVAPEGHAVDLAYDACGDLWLSYQTGKRKRTTANMAHWNSLDQTWSARQVDIGVRRWVTSIANPEGGCGSPAMTYGVDSPQLGELRFVEDGLAPVVVDSGPGGEGDSFFAGSGVATQSSVGYSSDGAPAVAYSYLDQDGCRSIKFASRSSGAWTPEFVYDFGGRVVGGTGLAFQDDVPVIAFTDTSDGFFKFCERSDGWLCDVINPRGFSNPSTLVDDQESVIVSASKWHGIWIYRRAVGSTEWHAERIGDGDVGDSALDPRDNPAICYWRDKGLNLAYVHPGTCSSDAHCDDSNPCTTDFCNSSFQCEHLFLEDGTQCGGSSDACCAGQCLTRRCAASQDCDDGDECTIDRYISGGNPPCSSYCEHDPDPACGGCVPTHSKEKGPRCTDGIDNDCDGLVDGNDPDC
jgi:hypothetical protein